MQVEYAGIQLAIGVDNHDLSLGRLVLSVLLNPVDCVGNVISAILTNVILQVGNGSRSYAGAVLVVIGGVSEQDDGIIIVVEGENVCSLSSSSLSGSLIYLSSAVSRCKVSSAVQLIAVIAVQNNAGSTVSLSKYLVNADLGVVLNSAVQGVLDNVAACNIIAILGPNLDGLGAVPDLEYVVVGLVSIGGLGSLEYVTVVNVGAALYVIGAKVGIYNLSVRNTIALVSQNDRREYGSFLPVTEILAGNNLEAVGLVTYEYNCILIDSRYATLGQLIVLNIVRSNNRGNNIVTSLVRAAIDGITNDLQLVLITRLGVGYNLNLSSISSGRTVKLAVASSCNVIAIDSFGLLQGNSLLRAVSLQQGSIPLVALPDTARSSEPDPWSQRQRRQRAGSSRP